MGSTSGGGLAGGAAQRRGTLQTQRAGALPTEAASRGDLAGRAPSPGPGDAIESLRVAIAATRSLQQQRSVEIAEVN